MKMKKKKKKKKRKRKRNDQDLHVLSMEWRNRRNEDRRALSSSYSVGGIFVSKYIKRQKYSYTYN